MNDKIDELTFACDCCKPSKSFDTFSECEKHIEVQVFLGAKRKKGAFSEYLEQIQKGIFPGMKLD